MTYRDLQIWTCKRYQKKKFTNTLQSHSRILFIFTLTDIVEQSRDVYPYRSIIQRLCFIHPPHVQKRPKITLGILHNNSNRIYTEVNLPYICCICSVFPSLSSGKDKSTIARLQAPSCDINTGHVLHYSTEI